MVSLSPLLLSQWHPTLNLPLLPESVTAGSGRKVFWVCPLGHDYECRIAARTGGAECSYCKGRKVLAGFNDLATTHPKFAAEWHTTKNGDLTPQQTSRGSMKLFIWLCPKGHPYEMSPNRRTARNVGCPTCSGHKVLVGFNDLKTLNPKLAAEWHPTLNTILPTEVTVGNSTHKVFWACPLEGHEPWQSNVRDRNAGHGCPACGLILQGVRKKAPIVGVTDFATLFPETAKEWHPTKNGELLPSHLKAGSNVTVWWLCGKNHEYSTPLHTRTGKVSSGCSQCWAKTFVSTAEQELHDFIVSSIPDMTVVQSDKTVLKGKELDIYIPELNFAVEFNGLFWHSEGTGKSKFLHFDKFTNAEAAGVKLLQVWEDDWNKNRGLVLRRVLFELGLEESHSGVLTAGLVEVGEAEQFLSVNHLEGHSDASFFIGLRTVTGVLTAVMTVLEHTDGSVSVVRYAATCDLSEGLVQLLEFLRDMNVRVVDVIVDNTANDGGLFTNAGFVKGEVLPLRCTYFVDRVRTVCDEVDVDLPNMDRIWDAGRTCYSIIL